MKVSVRPGFSSMTRAMISAIAFLTLGSPLSSYGALGEHAQTIPVEQAQMRATLRTVEASTFTVHEMRTPNGTVIREYVSRTTERVFGVTWQGPFIPDLKQLLGSYFQRFSHAAEVQRRTHLGRRPLDIRESALVVQTAGHMRAFFGRAYDPELLPAGVNANEIR